MGQAASQHRATGQVALVDQALTAERVRANAANEGEWTFPLEAVFALTSSALKEVVFQRCEAGDPCDRKVHVYARGDRLFAQVRFPKTDRWLLLPMDVWLKPSV